VVTDVSEERAASALIYLMFEATYFSEILVTIYQSTLHDNTEDHNITIFGEKYEGESNENRKTEIKIRNIAPLSYKLADMLPML
jgi:hypothetical protein